MLDDPDLDFAANAKGPLRNEAALWEGTQQPVDGAVPPLPVELVS